MEKHFIFGIMAKKQEDIYEKQTKYIKNYDKHTFSS
jgi:hypothetical protein